jgi:WS/DGAT/MGAT family acyltransferase
MDECKTIREHVADVTINDIFLATCGGAVRRYLAAKGDLPAQSLSAMMPISTRGEKKDADAGNQVGMVPVLLRSDIADPIERMEKVRRGSRESKGVSSVLGHDFPAKLIQILPAIAAEGLISRGLAPMCNATVSNVRGPGVPMYMAGARLQVFLPISAVINGIGLNITGFSYNGILWVCFVSCRKMLPDPKFFRQCLNESFAEIVSAAKKRPRADAHADTAPKPRARPAPKKAAKTAPKPSAPRKTSAPGKAPTPRKAATPRKATAPVKRKKNPAASA